MTYAFGIDIPVIETMLIITILFIIGVAFMIWQMFNVRKHIGILESTTLEIRRYEEEEGKELQRFEQDIANFESDEAEFFLAKMLPSLTQTQNFAANRLLSKRRPEQVVAELMKKGIQQELATQVVNSIAYYLQYYDKTPKQQNAKQTKVGEKLGQLQQ
ncbi:hypothetical protein GOV07_00520 [Candidatus Woesearchaeota archaeon]|nr:hypothetical protein [Candidatus Woesearchaeota archaeon]